MKLFDTLQTPNEIPKEQLVRSSLRTYPTNAQIW